mmetsp:Transcript_45391/g.117516  ORF Transcript_45391/g.117516 Transcript_45391/m.117516 type:complete len:1067 (-) Transcript_45391:528-3728(-)
MASDDDLLREFDLLMGTSSKVDKEETKVDHREDLQSVANSLEGVEGDIFSEVNLSLRGRECNEASTPPGDEEGEVEHIASSSASPMVGDIANTWEEGKQHPFEGNGGSTDSSLSASPLQAVRSPSRSHDEKQDGGSRGEFKKREELAKATTADVDLEGDGAQVSSASRAEARVATQISDWDPGQRGSEKDKSGTTAALSESRHGSLDDVSSNRGPSSETEGKIMTSTSDSIVGGMEGAEETKGAESEPISCTRSAKYRQILLQFRCEKLGKSGMHLSSLLKKWEGKFGLHRASSIGKGSKSEEEAFLLSLLTSIHRVHFTSAIADLSRPLLRLFSSHSLGERSILLSSFFTLVIEDRWKTQTEDIALSSHTLPHRSLLSMLEPSLEQVRLLLLYFDPKLYSLLELHQAQPKHFAGVMLGTLFARGEDDETIYAVWDEVLEERAIFLPPFIVSALVLSQRREIGMKVKEGQMLGFLRSLQMGSKEKALQLVARAKEMARSIPSSFSPLLRSTWGHFQAGSVVDAMNGKSEKRHTDNVLSFPPIAAVTISADDFVRTFESGAKSEVGKYFAIDCRPKPQYDRCHFGASFHFDPALFRFKSLADVGRFDHSLPQPVFEAIDKMEGARGSPIAVLSSEVGGSEAEALCRCLHFLSFPFVTLVKGGFSEAMKLAKRKKLHVLVSKSIEETESPQLHEKRMRATEEAKRALEKASRLLSAGVKNIRHAFEKGKKREGSKKGFDDDEEEVLFSLSDEHGGDEKGDDDHDDIEVKSNVGSVHVWRPDGVWEEAWLHDESVSDGWRKLDEWFEVINSTIDMARSSNDAKAVLAVAHALSEGKGVNPRPGLAVELYERAAGMGSPEAMRNLGYFYSNGVEVEKNIKKAIECYEVASTMKDLEAAANLGYIYLQSVKPSQPEKALPFLQMSAAGGVTRAQYQLAKLLEKGVGVPADKVEAFGWYRRAAEGGHVLAMNVIGVMFAGGVGDGTMADTNELQAAIWFFVAAAMGSKSAKANLKTMEETMQKKDIEVAIKMGKEMLAQVEQRKEEVGKTYSGRCETTMKRVWEAYNAAASS